MKFQKFFFGVELQYLKAYYISTVLIIYYISENIQFTSKLSILKTLNGMLFIILNNIKKKLKACLN